MARPLTLKQVIKNPGREKVISSVVSVLMIGVISASQIAPVLAVTAEDLRKLDQQITQAQRDSAHKAEAQGILGVEASSLGEAIDKLQAQINESESRISQLQADMSALNTQINEAETELARQKKVLGEVIKVLYVDGDISTVEMLASSRTFSEYVDRQEYRKNVSTKVQDTMKKIDRLKNELQEKRGSVEAALAEQQALSDQLASQRAEKDRVLAMNQAQQSQLESQVKANSRQLARLKKERAEGEAALARALQSGSYRKAQAGTGAVGTAMQVGAIGNTGFSSGPHLHLEMRNSRGIISPVPYIQRQPVSMPPAWISQSYGTANPLYKSGYHSGIDYAARIGAPIYAIAPGKMYRGCSNDLLGTTKNNYGYVAIVEHANGVKSIYAHMSGGPTKCNYNTYN